MCTEMFSGNEYRDHVCATFLNYCAYTCRMLGAEEAVRQAVETREAQVKEKAESLEETETRHR